MKFLVLLFSFFFLLKNVFAFSLSPLSQSIELGKNLNTVIYQIENKNKEPIAVESSLKIRKMGEDGKEELPDVAETDFLIYPTQLILKPGEKRGVKVQYLGSTEIKNELALRVLVEQLPIDFEKRKQTGVKLLLRYLGALYITKEDFTPLPVVKRIESSKEEIKIEVFNEGLSHVVFKNLKVSIVDGSVKYSLNSDKLEGFNGENLLAKKKRVFVIKNSLGKSISKNAKVTLKYDE